MFLKEKDVLKDEWLWEQQRVLLNRKYKIKQEKRQLKNKYRRFTTTKLLILFLFISCTIIEVFTGWVTVQTMLLASTTGIAIDFSPLVCLIGAVVGEVFGFAIYSIKAMKENSQNGVVYMAAQHELDKENKGVG